MLVKGRLISADALHTQCAFCFRVKRWQGDYLLIAKDNQATLAEDLRLFTASPPADCRDWRSARTIDKGHGRLEIRELVASTELNEFLGGKWAGVAQVFRLTRTVSEKGQMRKAGHLWHHQPLVGPSHSRPTPGVGSRTLDDRKSAALAP